MNAILDIISSYIPYWPLAVFCALMLAGINLPISEDVLIVLSAGICQQEKSLVVPTLIAIYSGTVLSDCVSYGIGYAVSRGFLNFRFFRKPSVRRKIKVFTHRLEKHGFFTFITFRLVPFGLRNILFITSGFVKLKFINFILFDSIAAFISNMTLFWLVYLIGSSGSLIGKIIGCVVLLIVAVFIFRSFRKFKKELKEVTDEETSGNINV